MLWGVAACSRRFPGFTDTKPMQPPTNPRNHRTTKPTCMNLWNQIHETEKPVKPRNSWNHKTQGIRKVLTKSLSLDETYYITKPAKPMKNTKLLKSQNSWNHETSKLWHLRKFRRPRSSKRFQVPCEQHEILNTKKPLKSQNSWNHETSKL